MRILMIAPPGAGKGTQGALIAAHFDVPHIATGGLLRDHVARQTALGRAVQEYLDRGALVPDQIVLDMLREAMIWIPPAIMNDAVNTSMAPAISTGSARNPAANLGMKANTARNAPQA